MQQIVFVLAILLLLSIVPKQYNEKTEKTTSIMKMQKIQEKETVKWEDDDYSDNDFSICCSVIDISSL